MTGPRAGWSRLGGVILAAAALQTGPAAGQGYEYNERVCNNLQRRAEMQEWAEPAVDYSVLTGDYDDPARDLGPADWRLETVCGGRFLRAQSLVADISASILWPVPGEPARFTDFYETRWVFTLDGEGGVEKLEITPKGGKTMTAFPIARSAD